MGGFLGYHPDAVLTLRRAVAAARSEADRARCDDPLAADAAARLRRASSLLAPWESRLAAVLDCAFATPYRRVAADVELPFDYQRLVDPAWTVVTDPLAAPPPPLDAAARAGEVVALVLALDPSQLADAAFVDRLDAVLTAVFADVVAAARCFAALGADGFAAVARMLAAAASDDEEGGPGAGAAVVLRRLALGFGAAVRRGEVDEAEFRSSLLEGRRAEPLAAAMVLAGGALPTAMLTAWALAIVQGSGVTAPTAVADAAAMAGHPTGAYVLEALTRDPAAGRAVLQAMLTDLDLLLGPHLPAAARGRFLLATSDPRHVDVAATVPTVIAVLDYLMEHPGVATSELAGEADGHLRAWLGAYVGPYLLPLSGTDGRSADALAWVAQDPAAATSLQAWILRTADTGFQQVFRMPAGADRAAGLADVCRRLGIVVESLADGRVAWASRAHARYAGVRGGLNLGLAQGLTELGDRFLPGSSLLTGPVAQWFVDGALEEASDQGVLGEPPTADSMRRLMADHGDRLEARIMVAAVAAHYQALRDAGEAPVGVPAPTPAKGAIGDDYRHDLQAWAGVDPARRAIADTADSAQHAVSTGRRERGRLAAGDDVPGVDVVPPVDDRFDDRFDDGGIGVTGSPSPRAGS